MNIYVTGGEGFLGLNLIQRLVRDGHTVVSLDDQSTSDPLAKVLAIADEPKMADVTWLHHDVVELDPTNWRADWPSPDAIFHLACPASPPRYQKDPIKTLRTCIEGSWNVFELGRRLEALVVHASTSEIYGENWGTMSEEMVSKVRCNGPRSCYDVGKMAAETVAREYPDVRVARIFNSYGPYMDPGDGRMIPNFICQLLGGRDLTVYGAGDQTRSITYATDTIDGLVRLLNWGAIADTTPEERTFNLGSEIERTVRDVAELVISTGMVMGVPDAPGIGISHKHKLPEDDPPRRRPSTRRAQLVLGWEPKIGMFQGLAQTIEYFERRLGGR